MPLPEMLVAHVLMSRIVVIRPQEYMQEVSGPIRWMDRELEQALSDDEDAR